jgi:hypothetical protein
MSEAALQQLLDRELIQELKARYFRFADDHDWEAFRALFCDDARVEIELLPEPIDGPDGLVAINRRNLAGARVVHHGHMAELTIDGPTEAHGRWTLNDYVEWPPDPETGERRGFRGYGGYEETYRKVDGAWRIASMRITHRRVDALLPKPLPAAFAGGPDILNTP